MNERMYVCLNESMYEWKYVWMSECMYECYQVRRLVIM
jgi:hypothetical protein